MSHKSKDLGRCLYRSRFGKSTKNIENNRVKSMKSVLEETEIQKIFSLGALADKDYTAIRVIKDTDREGILNHIEKKRFEEAETQYSQLLSIPRRPKGARYMTKEELLAKEKEMFLNWRRQLAEIENDKRFKMTPYELNLEFWRQLWRVIERSDILVQVVDARNPLLFRNADLENYVKEVDRNKINVVLINKADFLTENQRKEWAKYFDSLHLRVIFWSAKEADEKRKNAEKLAKISEEDIDETNDKAEKISESNDDEEDEDEETDSFDESKEHISESDNYSEAEEEISNKSDVFGVDEIIEYLESFKIKKPIENGKVTVGLVGYPNVGKSSTINAIFGRKKVSVSATPGHTKRFQTLIVTDKLVFCDCPGLVMPSLVHSKGSLMVSGILPIDHIRDYIAPINIIADQFPRETLELLYGIKLPLVREGEDPNRPPTARELLSSYSYMHGMMTSKGNPNLDRAARIILKDYVDGRLLYRHPPPTIDPVTFESAADLPEEKKRKFRAPMANNGMMCSTSVSDQLDAEIPVFNLSKIKELALHDAMKRIQVGPNTGNAGPDGQSAKPWRINNKRGKKEKMRRIHANLDKHEYVYK